MKIKTFTIKILLSIFLACLFFVSMAMIDNSKSVYARKQENYEEENVDIVPLSMANNRSDNVILISGKNNYVDPFETAPLNDFTNVKYIPNANYFLINPRHHINDGSDNSGGTCTTVAVQMLLGYHNYYTDRRIIPSSGNGRTFLDEDYGNLEFSSDFKRSRVNGQGCFKIGTMDGVYEEIFNRTWISDIPGIGQSVGLVKDGAVRFINEFTSPEAKNNISLTSGFFSMSQACADINEGIPIVLGMDRLFHGVNFHVVIAYGYANLDGVDGFLVHYGWGDGATQVWVPASWFGFQIRMSVDHVHTLADVGVIMKNTHRQLNCTICGYSTLDQLYNITNSTITGNRYPLFGNITVPNSIDIYSQNTASFTTQIITNIGPLSYANQPDLTEITISGSIVSIGDNAFENCTSLTGISFPAGITSIGNGAFRGCSSLTNISMSSNITSIGNNAFAYCSGLTSITIPSKVTEIGYNAFQHCSKLSSITIPSTVQWIGGYAFANCTELSSVVFQESCQLTSIGNNAFENCTSLTSIDIPEGIQYIYIETFSNCSAMSSIKIPYSVDDVANHAFAGCTSLTTVYYGGESETDWNSISIGTNNTKLVSAKRYYLKESQPTEYGFFWRYVSNAPQAWPFYGIKYTLIDNKEYEVSKGGEIVGTLQIPSTYNGLPVGRIAKWGFANSLNITKIIIPASITVLYGSSFSNCPNVESISVDTNNTVYMSQGNCIISRKNVELIVGCKNSNIPAGITKIGDYAFNGCSTLTSITIPNSVKYIGFSAFENCTGLTSINIPSSVTEIDAYAFYGCSSLANITIPNGVESIGSYAFYGTGLTSISIPSSVESIGEEAFGGNYLTEINVQSGNSYYYSEEGVLFGSGGVLMVYPKVREGVYIVPDGTTEIGNYAFYGCYQLKGIVIPSSVTKINDYAFVGCDQLEEFIFAEGSTLEYIGYEAFVGCWALEEITIPSSVTYVGALAFATWEEHQKIVVQADVSVLEQWDVDWAVDCFAEIEWDGYNLVATEGLGYILTDNGYEVEVGSSLEHSNGVVIIPAEYEGYPVIGVADNGFAGRSELIKVIFAGNNLIRIGTNAFGGCHNLIAINIPDGVTEIGDNAFYGCHQLQNVRLPRTVERIGDSVFAECHNLKSVTVPGGVVYVEANALEGAVGYTIYTEMGSNPSEWHFLNNNPECAIFYNCMLSEDGMYVVFIVIQEENYINADPSAPYRDGYVLLGWTTVYGGDVEYTMQEVADGAIDYGTVLYAVWQREV